MMSRPFLRVSFALLSAILLICSLPNLDIGWLGWAALVLPGQSDDVHLVLFTPDGKRFDAIGTTSGVMSRGTDIATAIPNERLTQAVVAASTQPRSDSSPACQPNPADTGPRWIPVPCTLPAAQSAPPGGRP